MNCTKNRTLVTFALSNINKMADFYAVCAVCVTTFSTSGEIPPGFKLHALTQVARSYAHLLAITRLHAHPHHEFWHVHTRNTKKPRLYQTLHVYILEQFSLCKITCNSGKWKASSLCHQCSATELQQPLNSQQYIQRIVRVGGCPAVVAQWQSTGGSSQRCPGFDSQQLSAFSLSSIFTS